MKQDITKYYCDCCKEEIPFEEFSIITVKINLREKYRSCRDDIALTQEVCDKCMKDLGFEELAVETQMLPKIKTALSANFKNIVSKICNRPLR
jgi:hypothetical protein